MEGIAELAMRVQYSAPLADPNLRCPDKALSSSSLTSKELVHPPRPFLFSPGGFSLAAQLVLMLTSGGLTFCLNIPSWVFQNT